MSGLVFEVLLPCVKLGSITANMSYLRCTSQFLATVGTQLTFSKLIINQTRSSNLSCKKIHISIIRTLPQEYSGALCDRHEQRHKPVNQLQFAKLVALVSTGINRGNANFGHYRRLSTSVLLIDIILSPLDYRLPTNM